MLWQLSLSFLFFVDVSQQHSILKWSLLLCSKSIFETLDGKVNLAFLIPRHISVHLTTFAVFLIVVWDSPRMLLEGKKREGLLPICRTVLFSFNLC